MRAMRKRAAIAIVLSVSALALVSTLALREPAPAPVTRAEAPGADRAPEAAREPPVRRPAAIPAEVLAEAPAETSPEAEHALARSDVPEALRRAPWAELAAEVRVANGAARARGPFDAGLGPRLERLSMELAGELPTAAGNGRGEVTHPLVAAELVAALLEGGGLAMTPAQRSEAVRLAERFDEALEREVAASGEEKTRLRRLIDEIEMKREFLDALREVLVPPQRELLRGLAPPGGDYPEVLSPVAIAEYREVGIGADIAAFREGLAGELGRSFGLPAGRAQALTASLFRRMAPLLEGEGGALPEHERALIAGRAQAELLEEILREPGLDASMARKARMLSEWIVPFVP